MRIPHDQNGIICTLNRAFADAPYKSRMRGFVALSGSRVVGIQASFRPGVMPQGASESRLVSGIGLWLVGGREHH